MWPRVPCVPCALYAVQVVSCSPDKLQAGQVIVVFVVDNKVTQHAVSMAVSAARWVGPR